MECMHNFYLKHMDFISIVQTIYIKNIWIIILKTYGLYVSPYVLFLRMVCMHNFYLKHMDFISIVQTIYIKNIWIICLTICAICTYGMYAQFLFNLDTVYR